METSGLCRARRGELPREEATEVSLRTVIEYLRAHPEIELVRFVLWDDTTLAAYERELQRQSG